MILCDRVSRAIAAAVLLVAGAVAVCVAGGEPAPSGRQKRDEGLHLVGGLGAGTALDLHRCAYGFDPRVGTSCDARHDLLPGAQVLCPRHAGLLP